MGNTGTAPSNGVKNGKKPGKHDGKAWKPAERFELETHLMGRPHFFSEDTAKKKAAEILGLPD
jgi:hypothetical protein